MKKAVYLVVLVAAALILPARSSADSFTFSLNSGKTQTDLNSFTPDSGKNGFTIEVPASSPLAFRLLVDSLFESDISAVWVSDYKVVNGHHELINESEFQDDHITGLSLGLWDRFHFSFKHDPDVATAPEPSAFLLLMGGIAGLGFLKRRFA